MASRIVTPGTRVEIMLSGLWEGPFTATHHGGRTPEHLVLRAADGTMFEVYNDAPHNIREVHTCTSQCDGCHTMERCTPGTHRHGELLLCGDCHPIVKAHGMDALEWAR